VLCWLKAEYLGRIDSGMVKPTGNIRKEGDKSTLVKKNKDAKKAPPGIKLKWLPRTSLKTSVTPKTLYRKKKNVREEKSILAQHRDHNDTKE